VRHKTAACPTTTLLRLRSLSTPTKVSPPICYTALARLCRFAGIPIVWYNDAASWAAPVLVSQGKRFRNLRLLLENKKG
jgi:hypothetical protein